MKWDRSPITDRLSVRSRRRRLDPSARPSMLRDFPGEFENLKSQMSKFENV
jgi:hypothetical protein